MTVFKINAKKNLYCKIKSWVIFWLLLSGIPTIVGKNQVQAQIIPDNTLGGESSVVTPVNPQRDRIDGGAIRNNNLFHSFTEFNIGEGREAYFSNPAAIENIFSRVTGSNPSRIFGKLGVLGDANLYFLNPNGIIFGENSSLDIKGSFFASTASSIDFGEGKNYSAINPTAPPLLSVNVKAPVGLQFEGGEGDINNQGNLTVGKDLSLNANNLTLRGRLEAGKDLTLKAETVKVRDSVEKPFIAAANGNLLVQGKDIVDIFALNNPGSGLFSGRDMILSSANPVVGDIHFWSAGNFQIEKLDGNKGDLFSFYDPIIRSQGDVSIFGYQGASLHILAGGKVDINTAIITNPDTTGESINPVSTPNLANVTLSDGTSLVIDGSQKPTLDIRAGVDAAVIGNPLGTLGDAGIFFDSSINPVASPSNNPVATSADITIGDVLIDSPSGLVLLTNQYEPNLSLQGGDITVNEDGAFGIGIDARGFRGDGSDVFIDAKNGITLNSAIDTSALSDESGVFYGNGGDVTLLAKDNIMFNPGSVISSWGLLGGNISVATNADFLVKGSGLGGGINSVSFALDSGITGGDIQISAKSLLLSNGSELGTFTFRNANAGDVIIQANETVSLEGFDNDKLASVIRSQTLQGSTGNAGNINIDTRNLRIFDGAQISAGTLGNGKGGILNTKAESVELIGTGIHPERGEVPSTLSAAVFSGARGNGGEVKINANSLFLLDGGAVTVATFGFGNAGDLSVKAKSIEVIGTGNEEPSGLFATVTPSATGMGGNLNIETDSLRVANGGQISSSTAGLGNSGDLTVKATEIELTGTSADDVWGSGLFSTVTRSATGKGGQLTLETNKLHINDGAVVSVTTSGNGDAGNLIVKAQSMKLIGYRISNSQAPSGLFTQVNPAGKGNGGQLIVEVGSLHIADGAQLSSSTFSEGSAGDLVVTADSVEVIGFGGLASGLFAQVNPEATGSAGNLKINTSSLKIADGAKISASTFGNGNAGNIQITANIFEATNNGQILTTTSSGEKAGNITLNIKDNLTLTGTESGIFANTTENSTGNGGSIILDPRTVNIKDGAQISVDSQGTGTGGNIELTAGTLNLDRGTISAKTRSNTGGDITLNIQDLLLLRNNSQISTTAGDEQFGGNGGNINVNSPDGFIVAFPKEDSDITANAFQGNGGNVDITAFGLFGIEFRDKLTSLSDITASSQLGFDGNVNIETPGIEPNPETVELPEDAQSTEVAQGCQASGKAAVAFFNIGRGGLPQQPGDTLRSEDVIAAWIPLVLEESQVDEKVSRVAKKKTVITDCRNY